LSNPNKRSIHTLLTILILLASFLGGVAVGVYRLPPLGVLSQVKLLLHGDEGGIKYGPYYFQKVSFFDLIKSESKIVMVGDSITDRCEWSELLSGNGVINRGIDGDTTAGVLNRIDKIIALIPQKVFLMIGINDLGKNIPVSKILSNYQNIIAMLLAENIDVFVQSTLNVGRNQIQRNLQVNELNNGLKAYCKDHGVKFIDLNSILAPDGFLLDKYSNGSL